MLFLPFVIFLIAVSLNCWAYDHTSAIIYLHAVTEVENCSNSQRRVTYVEEVEISPQCKIETNTRLTRSSATAEKQRVSCPRGGG